jgi:UDP-N-acetyl-D-galactosamine dehydrogenase
VPGVHRASSIKTAEAAKVIENTSATTISLMNELAITSRNSPTRRKFLQQQEPNGISVHARLLVGGHRIAIPTSPIAKPRCWVTPHRSFRLDAASTMVRVSSLPSKPSHMIAAGSYVKGAKVNVMGLTFKEYCISAQPKVIDIINELKRMA